MKKAMLVLAMVAGISMAFVSCGKKGTCDVCQKENVTVTEVTTEVAGQKVTANLCKDCKKAADAAEKAVEVGAAALEAGAELLGD
ncbi:MAG: hypothetical protein SO116_07765 [Treponema sp.]|nr:hypothetical protein [Spirochaetales bacterium]MDY4902750.1 hypothetical protein [Treponema sp.]